APCATARPYRNRRRDELDQGNARADAAALLVKCLDGGVGAVAFGLGRQDEHDETGKQAAERDHERQGPASTNFGYGCGTAVTFARRYGRFIVREAAQEELRRQI